METSLLDRQFYCYYALKNYFLSIEKFMKKFKDLPFYKQVACVYTYSVLFSLLFSPLFGKISLLIFHPRLSSGLSLFPQDRLFLFDGTLEASFLFLSFFSFFLLKKNIIFVWLFGFIFPFLMIVNSIKEIFWVFLLSFLGWGMAKGLLFFSRKKR